MADAATVHLTQSKLLIFTSPIPGPPMASVALLRSSIMSSQQRPAAVDAPRLRRYDPLLGSMTFPRNHTLSLLQSKRYHPPTLQISYSGGNGNDGIGRGGRGGDGGGDEADDGSSSTNKIGFGLLIGLLLSGWRDRVAADPQFPFKVLMEEIVGVTASILGDMASRPNFGLNELDFVFSTLVVGSILNFVLMFLLAPTASVSSQNLPFVFAGCPKSHMFEPGPYSLANRVGTLVYKGTVFGAVGLGAGLVGTAISNSLIMIRKKIDPNFETPNKAPPTMLNAMTWAIQMGVSSNLRYQMLNGIEFLLEKAAPVVVFKTSVVALRCGNNVLGGMSFVTLARLTGSQSVG